MSLSNCSEVEYIFFFTGRGRGFGGSDGLFYTDKNDVGPMKFTTLAGSTQG